MRRFLGLATALAILLSGLGAPVASATTDPCLSINESNVLTSGTTCTGEITIPDAVTSIGEYAFIQSESLISITIPASVTSIGVGAFQGATSLTSVTFSGTSRLETISASVFGFATSLTSITIPASVTSIGGSAFEGATSLTSINIPANVTSIAGYTFSGSGLTSISIPASVTDIGNNAFAYTGLTNVTIPDSVTLIGESAFIGYSGLQSFTVGEGNTTYKSEDSILFNKDGSTLIAYPSSRTGSSYVIPDGVTSIGHRAFFGASAPTSITIPGSVTSIGYQAFYSTEGLASIIIPSSVTLITNNAFQSSGIKGITITSSTTAINEDTFYGTALETIRFLGNEVPTSVSSNLGAPVTARAIVNDSATKADFPLVDQKWNGLRVVTVAEAEAEDLAAAADSTEPSTPSAEALAATAREAARVAEVAREAATMQARSELVASSSAPLTVDKFASAGISGITAKNLGAVSAEIAALPIDRRGEIGEILKIARKFEVVDIVATSARINASMLQEIGLIKSDNKNRSSITAALAKLPASERASYAAIESAIATVMKKIQDRKDRLEAAKARSRR